MAKRHIRTDVPNLAQRIYLGRVRPSTENCRLFVEKESLTKLRKRYADFNNGATTVLPDPPILRMVTEGTVDHNCLDCEGNGADACPNNLAGPRFEILAGERRITAAKAEGLQWLPCRVVQMSDEEAYRFIIEHNAVAGLTTVELAFRAAEMDRLGFSPEEIGDVLGGVSANRYITVGMLVNPDHFSDAPKLADPSIVEWHEAALFGEEHFARCFRMWNAGVWDEKACTKHFRKRGEALPIDNAEKGFRTTFDLNKFVVRGQIDLDIMDITTAEQILHQLATHVAFARALLREQAHFGARDVRRINPETI